MLKIEKTKILYFPYENLKGYRNLTKVKDGIFRKMNDTVEIADNVTFGDFFKFLIKEKELVNTIFTASLYGVPFDLFIKDFKKESKFDDQEIHYLEIYWYVDFEEDGLYIGSRFHGFGSWNVPDVPNQTGPVGIFLTPINELKNYPLRLNEVFEIYSPELKQDNESLILKTTKRFTLYDIINAIFFELTWYGTPETRDKEGKAMLEDVSYTKIDGDIFVSEVNMRSLRKKRVSKKDKFLPLSATDDQV